MIKRFLLFLSAIAVMGCSSVNTLQEEGADEYWPYGGIRNINETYSEEKWGKARYPAMIVDAPFSFTFDTVGVLCHPELWFAFLEASADSGFYYLFFD